MLSQKRCVIFSLVFLLILVGPVVSSKHLAYAEEVTFPEVGERYIIGHVDGAGVLIEVVELRNNWMKVEMLGEDIGIFSELKAAEDDWEDMWINLDNVDFILTEKGFAEQMAETIPSLTEDEYEKLETDYYTLKYPQEWNEETSYDEEAEIFSTALFVSEDLGVFSVTCQSIEGFQREDVKEVIEGGRLTEEEFAKIVEIRKEDENFDELEFENHKFTLKGQPAEAFIFKDDKRRIMKVIFTYKDDKYIEIIYTPLHANEVYEEYEGLVNFVIESFEVELEMDF